MQLVHVLRPLRDWFVYVMIATWSIQLVRMYLPGRLLQQPYNTNIGVTSPDEVLCNSCLDLL